MQTIEACRGCGSSKLKVVESLGNQFVSDFVQPGSERAGEQVPITLARCRACNLVQQLHTASLDKLYKEHYWYTSGTTAYMRKHLGEAATDIALYATLTKGDCVIDIGSNDGTLLREFNVYGAYTVGFEPAKNLYAIGSAAVDLLCSDFWDADKYLNLVGRQAKVITAFGMLYDLPDPNKFICDVARALAPDGVFVAQLMFLQGMLDMNDIGNLAHEHLEFYTMLPLEMLLHKYGLVVEHVEFNACNGSSRRLYIRRSARMRSNNSLNTARRMDSLINDETISDFVERSAKIGADCREFIIKERALGKTFHGYGASTKGNVIAQYAGLNATHLDCIAEKDERKWGLVTAGAGIHIVSEAESRSKNPDYYVVMPYAFVDEFKAREAEFLSRGGKFVLLSPSFQVVGA